MEFVRWHEAEENRKGKGRERYHGQRRWDIFSQEEERSTVCVENYRQPCCLTMKCEGGRGRNDPGNQVVTSKYNDLYTIRRNLCLILKVIRSY